jgi:hypothetical protein
MEADPAQYNDVLIADARRDKFLGVHRIRKGSILELCLYEAKVILGTSSDAELLDITPDRTFVLEALGKDSEFRIRRMLINTRFENYETSAAKVHGLIQVGSHFPDEELFRYSLYHHSIAHYRTKDGVVRHFTIWVHNKGTIMWVGRCVLDGKEVFFDPPPESSEPKKTTEDS